MFPNYPDKSYYLVEKLTYKKHSPQRSDVVLYRKTFSDGKQVDTVGRIIALPGEKLKISNGKVFINDAKLPEPYLSPNATTQPDMTLVLSENHYFIVGDNRAYSSDSRQNGQVSRSDILEKFGICYANCPK